MRVHIVRHVPFEGPGAIAAWAASRGHEVLEVEAVTERLPQAGPGDMVVVMGGPMGALDTGAHPWLAAEHDWLRRTVDDGVLVLGVCLGAQLLAHAIGGVVHRGAEPEIGWYPVRLTDAGRASALLADWPDEAVVGHWHGDTFDLPAGVASLASSAVTPNQVFEAADGRVVGLQCHLEWSDADIEALVNACGDELGSGSSWVTDAAGMRPGADTLAACHDMLASLLDRLAARS